MLVASRVKAVSSDRGMSPGPIANATAVGGVLKQFVVHSTALFHFLLKLVMAVTFRLFPPLSVNEYTSASVSLQRILSLKLVACR